MIIASSATSQIWKKKTLKSVYKILIVSFLAFAFFCFLPISTSLPILSQFSQSKSLEPTIKIWCQYPNHVAQRFQFPKRKKGWILLGPVLFVEPCLAIRKIISISSSVNLHSKIGWRKSNLCGYGSGKWFWLGRIAHFAVPGKRGSSTVHLHKRV